MVDGIADVSGLDALCFQLARFKAEDCVEFKRRQLHTSNNFIGYTLNLMSLRIHR